MKLLHFNRKRLLRAIHAAALALMILAAREARAQTATSDGNGNVTISGSGTGYVYNGTSPTLTPGGTLSVTSGSTITDSGSARAVIILSESANINNAGNLTSNSSALNGTVSAIYTTGGSQATTITNSGTLSGVSVSNNFNSAGIYYDDGLLTSSPITISNSGSISASGAAEGSNAIYVNSGGDVTVTNTSSGILSSSNTQHGYVINVNEGATGSVVNEGSITGQGVYAGAIQVAVNGDLSIANSGTLIGQATTRSGYGIEAYSYGANVSVTNSGTITASSAGTPSFIYAQDIFAYTPTGNATITNSAPLSAISTGGTVSGLYILDGSGNASVTNTGSLYTKGPGVTIGIGTQSGSYDTGTFSILNAAPLTAISTSSGYAAGIYADTAGDIAVQSSGAISATTVGGSAYGVAAITSGGNATISNGSAITSASTGGDAYGLYASASGTASISNSASVTANSSSNASTASGIYASGGAVDITNGGDARGIDTSGGTGYGIQAGGGGPILVTNTGTATGTTVGIYTTSAARVNNMGLASGGSYSIDVASGSTVNLIGASPVQGIIKGGPDDRSTSLLNFQIVVAGNLAAAQAELNAAIADYDQSLTVAAKGPGDDVTSSVVTINGIGYQWQDFAGIADNLISYAEIPGFNGLGAAIDNFNASSPQGAAILAALANLPISQLPNALAQLSPQSLQVLRNIAFDNASFTAANVNDHLANLRDGLTGFDSSGFTVNAPGVDPLLTQVRSHLLAWNPAPETAGLLSDSPAALFGGDAKEMAPLVSTKPVDPWSTFISGSVILANLDNTFSNTGDADYTTGSVMAGADYRFDEHFTAGVLFDYSHTGADLDGNSSRATVDTYMPGVYGSYVNGPWYANGLFAYGFNRNKETRNVDIPGIAGGDSAAADGGQVTTDLTGGYEFKSGAFKYGPVAMLQYVHLHVDSFNESGATALTVGSEGDDSLRTQLGVEGRYSRLAPPATAR